MPGSPEFAYEYEDDEDGDGDDEGDEDEDFDGDADSGWREGYRGRADGDGIVEMFGRELEWEGVRFDRVRLFHPRQGTC